MSPARPRTLRALTLAAFGVPAADFALGGLGVAYGLFVRGQKFDEYGPALVGVAWPWLLAGSIHAFALTLAASGQPEERAARRLAAVVHWGAWPRLLVGLALVARTCFAFASKEGVGVLAAGVFGSPAAFALIASALVAAAMTLRPAPAAPRREPFAASVVQVVLLAGAFVVQVGVGVVFLVFGVIGLGLSRLHLPPARGGVGIPPPPGPLPPA